MKEAVKGDTATQHEVKASVHKEMAKDAGLARPGDALYHGKEAVSEKIQQAGKEVKHGA